VRYSVETLPGIIVAADPPLAYDLTVTVNQRDKKTIPPEFMADPGDVPEADPDAEPFITPPLVSPRMEISVNNRFFQLCTTSHLSFVDDPVRRLRIGTTHNFATTHPTAGLWWKWKGGIQQIRFYRDYLLTFPEIQNLHDNKMTIREMPFGSPALAGMMLAFEELSQLLGGFDDDAYEIDAYEIGLNDFALFGFQGFDSIGYDPEGFDTLFITNQGTIQNGGYDPRGFSEQGYHVLPTSQS
jgi:hypothetical protein